MIAASYNQVCRRGFVTLSRSRILSLVRPADVQLGGQEFVAMSLTQMMLERNDEAQSAMNYSLSFSDEQSVFVSTSARFDDIMKQQLLYGFQNGTIKVRKTPAMMTSMVPENKNRVDTAPLPATLVDALRPSKSRAIVVTESVKPFRVVDVNACWENLCGYTFCESKGKTLGELLKGPETNAVAATGLIAKLLLGEVEASTTLVNYTKLGRRFENRIRVGPLTDEAGNVTHFVGLLQEI